MSDDYDQRVFGMFGGREKYERSIEALVSFAAIQEGERVLELCCGTGISTKFLLQRTQRVVAVELNQERVEKAREHIPWSVPVLTKDALMFGDEHDGRYDVVACINGFHYFTPDEFYALAKQLIKAELFVDARIS